MPAVVEFRDVRPGDAQLLVAGMREADRLECWAAGVDDPLVAVEQSIAASTRCWTIEVNGRLVSIFGVAPCGTVLSPAGAPWLLGTDEVLRHKRALIRRVPSYIRQMLGLYPLLTNAVHARNHASVRWLRRLGFTLRDPVAVPPHGELFHPFEMRG